MKCQPGPRLRSAFQFVALVILLGVYPAIMMDMLEPAIDSIMLRVES